MTPKIIVLLHRTSLYPALDIGRDFILWLREGFRDQYAAHGEDRFVLDYFGRSGTSYRGVYIDVGANHPFRISNTYLLYRKGWRGLTLDPIKRFRLKHRVFRSRDTHLSVAAGPSTSSIEFYELAPSLLSSFDRQLVEQRLTERKALLIKKYKVPVETLTAVYLRHLSPQKVDVLSLDCEGYDLQALQGVDFSILRPRLIIVEMNQNETDAAIDSLLLSQDYRKILDGGLNVIYEDRRSQC